MKQKMIFADADYGNLVESIRSINCQIVMLVHGRSMTKLAVGKKLLALPDLLGIEVVEFSDFSSNPLLEAAIKGAAICRERKCEAIIACGGGSAIDVAKCIRLFVEADQDEPELLNHLRPGKKPLIAIPTTAGTGSESTHFAVVYKDGQKISVAEKDNIPQWVFFDPVVLDQLPMQQKRATFFDALCHAIESYWSVNATEESRYYAKKALKMMLMAEKYYLSSQAVWKDNMVMLSAANYAGKAINISKTTAAHAMCYKLTSMFGLPHGQAAVLCLMYLWPLMVAKVRDLEYKKRDGLEKIFKEIVTAMGVNSVEEGIALLQGLVVRHEMLLTRELANIESVIRELVRSVNAERLQNHPLKLTQGDFADVYRKIIVGRNEGRNHDED